MPHVGFADVGHKKERKGIMLFGKFQIYMPNAGFVGVRHREYTKVCDSAFLFRASSRAAGRRSNSKDNTVNGFMCMSNTRAAGVGHSRKAELIKQRYFHSMPYAGFAGVEHTKGMALNWVECWLVLVALLTLLCPTPAKPAWGINAYPLFVRPLWSRAPPHNADQRMKNEKRD